MTFPRAEPLRAAAKMAPDDRVLAETDAPYLAPVPLRGKRNEPAYVVRVIEALAAIRGATREQVAAQVIRNFEALFGPGASDSSPSA